MSVYGELVYKIFIKLGFALVDRVTCKRIPLKYFGL